MGLLNKMISPEAKNMNMYQDDTILVLDRKSVSRIIASMLLLGFFVFIAGYFLGKKKAIETFAAKVEQESFADQITYSLNTLYDEKQPHTIIQEVEVEEDIDAEILGAIPQLPVQAKAVQKPSEAATSMQPTQSKPAVAPKPVVSDMRYQAQLAGGNKKNMQAFADRLAKHGIPVEIKRRVSKTAKGDTIIWHQAVSAPYMDKQALELLVDRVKKIEKIGDVRIIELV